MTKGEAIRIIHNEAECIRKNVAGCDRKCEICPLVMDDKKILEAYTLAIKALRVFKEVPDA